MSLSHPVIDDPSTRPTGVERLDQMMFTAIRLPSWTGAWPRPERHRVVDVAPHRRGVTSPASDTSDPPADEARQRRRRRIPALGVIGGHDQRSDPSGGDPTPAPTRPAAPNFGESLTCHSCRRRWTAQPTAPPPPIGTVRGRQSRADRGAVPDAAPACWHQLLRPRRQRPRTASARRAATTVRGCCAQTVARQRIETLIERRRPRHLDQIRARPADSNMFR